MYKLNTNSVTRLSDWASIPFTNGNRDYEEYKQWLSEGNIPEPQYAEKELLDKAKEDKRNQIRAEFEVVSNLPVNVNGVDYVGGFESAIKLDAAKRMVEQAGATEVVFFDISNDPHVLSPADATTVVLSVGADYQIKFGIKQARMVAVENATTIQEVEVVA